MHRRHICSSNGGGEYGEKLNPPIEGMEDRNFASIIGRWSDGVGDIAQVPYITPIGTYKDSKILISES